MLGVALTKVELNETNFSEVLRLFVLSRNAGDRHPVTNAFHSIYLPVGGLFLNSFHIGKEAGGRGEGECVTSLLPALCTHHSGIHSFLGGSYLVVLLVLQDKKSLL